MAKAKTGKTQTQALIEKESLRELLDTHTKAVVVAISDVLVDKLDKLQTTCRFPASSILQPPGDPEHLNSQPTEGTNLQEYRDHLARFPGGIEEHRIRGEEDAKRRAEEAEHRKRQEEWERQNAEEQRIRDEEDAKRRFAKLQSRPHDEYEPDGEEAKQEAWLSKYPPRDREYLEKADRELRHLAATLKGPERFPDISRPPVSDEGTWQLPEYKPVPPD